MMYGWKRGYQMKGGRSKNKMLKMDKNKQPKKGVSDGSRATRWRNYEGGTLRFKYTTASAKMRATSNTGWVFTKRIKKKERTRRGCV
jgi:hypothetical protein